MTKAIMAGMLASAVLLASPYETKQEEIDSVVKTGQNASALLFKTLGGGLKKHMKSEGPLGAAKFCSINAYPLRDQVNAELGEGVSIKRISLANRNPGNAPTAGEKEVLEAFQTLKSNHVILPDHLVQQVDGDTYKYYKPLAIADGVCLKCHGDLGNNPQLADFLKKHYPEDKATGHKMGDLRGAIVVTVKK